MYDGSIDWWIQEPFNDYANNIVSFLRFRNGKTPTESPYRFYLYAHGRLGFTFSLTVPRPTTEFHRLQRSSIRQKLTIFSSWHSHPSQNYKNHNGTKKNARIVASLRSLIQKSGLVLVRHSSVHHCLIYFSIHRSISSNYREMSFKNCVTALLKSRYPKLTRGYSH